MPSTVGFVTGMREAEVIQDMMTTANNTLNEIRLVDDGCGKGIPTAQELLLGSPAAANAVIIIATILTLITVIIYIEEVIFAMKNFKVNRDRKVKTMWILAAYPVFAVTGLLAAVVPRASVLSNLVGHVFFSTCLYQFMRLTVDYLGGTDKMFELLKGAKAAFQSPPCCCCCPCLPTLPLVKPVFLKLQVLVLQVAIVRPILFFAAAILWANGTYISGAMRPQSVYLWITLINLVSTFTSIYGLVVMQRACLPVLMKFRMIPKFVSYPLMLVFTILPSIIVNFLVVQGVIPCTPLLPSKVRGDRIFHLLQVLVMVPFSIFGRRLYRNAAEAGLYADSLETVIAMMQQKKMAEQQNKNGGQPITAAPTKTAEKGGDEPPAYKIEDYIDARTTNV